MVPHWQDPGSLLIDPREYVNDSWLQDQAHMCNSSAELARVIDFFTYLPDDILVKVDRATMRVGLESRTLFLDRQLLEWSADVGTSLNLSNGSGKWI